MYCGTILGVFSRMLLAADDATGGTAVADPPAPEADESKPEKGPDQPQPKKESKGERKQAKALASAQSAVRAVLDALDKAEQATVRFYLLAGENIQAALVAFVDAGTKRAEAVKTIMDAVETAGHSKQDVSLLLKAWHIVRLACGEETAERIIRGKDTCYATFYGLKIVSSYAHRLEDDANGKGESNSWTINPDYSLEQTGKVTALLVAYISQAKGGMKAPKLQEDFASLTGKGGSARVTTTVPTSNPGNAPGNVTTSAGEATRKVEGPAGPAMSQTDDKPAEASKPADPVNPAAQTPGPKGQQAGVNPLSFAEGVKTQLLGGEFNARQGISMLCRVLLNNPTWVAWVAEALVKDGSQAAKDAIRSALKKDAQDSAKPTPASAGNGHANRMQFGK